jgi:hypothetical protein
MSFITNLYWRGDDSLLSLLLRMPNAHTDVVSDLGEFYAGLLDRRSNAIFDQVAGLPNEQQVLVCRLAYEDDLNYDSPKLKRIQAFLREQHSDAADRCLSVLSSTN